MIKENQVKSIVKPEDFLTPFLAGNAIKLSCQCGKPLHLVKVNNTYAIGRMDCTCNDLIHGTNAAEVLDEIILGRSKQSMSE